MNNSKVFFTIILVALAINFSETIGDFLTEKLILLIDNIDIYYNIFTTDKVYETARFLENNEYKVADVLKYIWLGFSGIIIYSFFFKKTN